VGVVNKVTPSEHVKIESRYLCIGCINLKLFEFVAVEIMI
jgi:hypothetical protein